MSKICCGMVNCDTPKYEPSLKRLNTFVEYLDLSFFIECISRYESIFKKSKQIALVGKDLTCVTGGLIHPHYSTATVLSNLPHPLHPRASHLPSYFPFLWRYHPNHNPKTPRAPVDMSCDTSSYDGSINMSPVPSLTDPYAAAPTLLSCSRAFISPPCSHKYTANNTRRKSCHAAFSVPGAAAPTSSVNCSTIATSSSASPAPTPLTSPPRAANLASSSLFLPSNAVLDLF